MIAAKDKHPIAWHPTAMCNLCSITRNQAAIRALACAVVDRSGNLPPRPGIFLDYQAPIMRDGPDGRDPWAL
jgi:hypothetical protein